MELFRISAKEYAQQLKASGAPNRWNKKGEFIIYAGSSRSLSTLEMIVHRGFIAPEIPYQIMVISVPDSEKWIRTIHASHLPENWRRFEAYYQLQEIGSNWYNRKETLLLKVPSAVIPAENNFMINTKHPDFKSQVKLIRQEPYFWDTRLL